MKTDAALKVRRYSEGTWLVGCPSGREYQVNWDGGGHRWCIYEETGMGGFVGDCGGVHDALTAIIRREQVLR